MESSGAKLAYAAQDYGSEFEYDSEGDKKRKRRQDLAEPAKAKKTKLPSKELVTEEYNKEEGRVMRYHIISMDAFSRHKKFVNDYIRYYCGSTKDFARDTSKDKTDYDVIRENHRFLWTDEDSSQESWEKSLAKRYWDKLFKEYCITDLSRYKENKIAMRWRVEKEVVSGKGQFICGNKTCDQKEKLRSWEVNFGYVEHGDKKNALVKLRLCPKCSDKLNYFHKRKEVTVQKSVKEVVTEEPKEKHKKNKKHKKHNRSDCSSSSDSDGSDTEWVEKPSTSQDSTSIDNSDSKENTDSLSDKDMWSAPIKITEDKTREEEFEDYFEDMFL